MFFFFCCILIVIPRMAPIDVNSFDWFLDDVWLTLSHEKKEFSRICRWCLSTQKWINQSICKRHSSIVVIRNSRQLSEKKRLHFISSCACQLTRNKNKNWSGQICCVHCLINLRISSNFDIWLNSKTKHKQTLNAKRSNRIAFDLLSRQRTYTLHSRTHYNSMCINWNH